MRKFILAAVLAAGVVFPAASRAEVNEFGVNLPAEKQTVTDDVRGGTVTQYPFYPITPQRLSTTQAGARTTAEKGSTYIVYGIHLSSNQVI